MFTTRTRCTMKRIPFLTLALLMAFPLLAPGQTSDPPAEKAQKKAQMQQSSEAMGTNCQPMAKQIEAAHAKQQKMDEQLDAMVQAMKQAKGEEQQQAMVNLLEKMVSTRHDMHAMMMEMQPAMMNHMAQHVHAGEGEAAHCPAMKAMREEGASHGSMHGTKGSGER